MLYIYTFLFSILCSFGAQQQIKKKVLFLLLYAISALPLILLAGYRDVTVGTDTLAYPMSVYNNAQYYTFSLYTSVEPLYTFLGYISYKLGGDFCIFLLMTHTLIVGCFFFGFWRLRRLAPLWMMTTFFCFLFFNMSIQLSRQSLALGVVFVGFTYLLEKKIWRFIVSVAIGFLFHRSVFFALFFIPFVYIENKRIQFWCFVGSIMTVLLYDVSLSYIVAIRGFEKFQNYSEFGAYEGFFSYSELFIRVLFICVILYLSKLKYSKSILLLFLTEFVLNLMQTKSRYVGRISLPMYILYFYYLPYFLTHISRRIRTSVMVKISVFSFVVFYWWFVYIYKCAGETYPYTSKILGI